jgi:hypothetical protein
MVKGRPNAKKLSLKCPTCKGTGKTLVSSEHKRWAAQTALEMSQVLPEKQPLVAVQQNQTNVIGGQGGLLEKMSQTADKILYDRPDIVDAEAVEVKDD